MCKENLWKDTDREIKILEIKYVTVPLRLPQTYLKKNGFECGPHSE